MIEVLYDEVVMKIMTNYGARKQWLFSFSVSSMALV